MAANTILDMTEAAVVPAAVPRDGRRDGRRTALVDGVGHVAEVRQ